MLRFLLAAAAVLLLAGPSFASEVLNAPHTSTATTSTVTPNAGSGGWGQPPRYPPPPPCCYTGPAPGTHNITKH